MHFLIRVRNKVTPLLLKLQEVGVFRSLRSEMVTINIICVLIPAIVVTAFQISYYHDGIKLDTRVSTNNVLNTISQSIYSYVSDLSKLMITIGYDKTLLSELESGPLKDADSPDDVFWSPTIQNYLKASNKNLMSVIVQDDSGRLRYYNKDIKTKLKPDEIHAAEYQELFLKNVWEREYVSLYGNHEPFYFTFSSNERVFSVMYTMNHPYDKNQKLYITADSDIAFFTELFSQVKFGSPSICAVFDENNNLVYSTQEIDSHSLLLLQKANGSIELEGNLYDIYSKSIIPSGWVISILLSDSLLQEKLVMAFKMNIALAAFILIISTLFFSMLSNYISNSFDDMSRVMFEVKDGNMAARCKINGRSELDDFKAILNDMILKLDDYITREYKLALTQKNVEMRALQSQIQPHFLYNTLNGFIWLNRNGQRDELEYSIINLTKLMRYVLNEDMMVTLESEMDFLQKYCDLQKLRFDERMIYSITYSEEVKNAVIPKFLLQPLVENSIVHALEPSDDICDIRIDAYRMKEHDLAYLVIKIEDDGAGFDPAKELNKERVGIKNVCERLEMIYPQSRIDINSRKGEGTRIKIKIKLNGSGLNETGFEGTALK